MLHEASNDVQVPKCSHCGVRWFPIRRNTTPHDAGFAIPKRKGTERFSLSGISLDGFPWKVAIEAARFCYIPTEVLIHFISDFVSCSALRCESVGWISGLPGMAAKAVVVSRIAMKERIAHAGYARNHIRGGLGSSGVFAGSSAKGRLAGVWP
jgi:hypothetical protein